MLLANVFAKALRDRTPMAAGIGLGLGALSFGLLEMARLLATETDNLFTGLPRAYTNLIGGPGGNFIITELFGILAPIAILIVGISAGVNALAGEESARTADLLLTQPVTRRCVVVSKAAALTVILLLCCALFLAGLTSAAALIHVQGFSAADAVAATVHLFFLGLSFGMIALLAGNLTGSSAAAAGFAAGLALLSDVAAGLLPLVHGVENAARLSPWYYYNGSQPLTNGISPGHLAVLAAIAAGAFVSAVVVVEHRDIGSGHAAYRIELGKFSRPNVATMFTKTLTGHSLWTSLTSSILIELAIVVSLMFDGLQSTLASISAQLPANLQALFGNAPWGTPEGWIQAEMLSLVVPIAFIAVAAVIGSGAIAGEDARGTLALLASLPVSRVRIVIENALSIAVAVLLTSGASSIGIVLGSRFGGLGLDSGNVLGANLQLACLGILFGCLALALGSATSHGRALGATALAAVTAYTGNWLLGLSSASAGFAVLSPWHYAVAGEPLRDGADPFDLVVLVMLSLLAVLAAAWLFERREIPQR
jgi:ABC-2 type transport system permease protein